MPRNFGRLPRVFRHEEFIGTLTVDPGFGGTGWALWGPGIPRPKLTGRFKPSPEVRLRSPEERLEDMFRQFKICLRLTKPYHVYLEGVALWGSAKSQAAATSGDLFFLSYLIGSYVAAVIEYGVPYTIIEPQVWCGQLNERQLVERVKLVTGENYPQHIADAVGMGLSILGEL